MTAQLIDGNALAQHWREQVARDCQVLQARGARLIGDASVVRGGCLVDSDIASVDGSVVTRWRRAAASLGSEMTWAAASAPTGSQDADEEDAL